MWRAAAREVAGPGALCSTVTLARMAPYLVVPGRGAPPPST
jgi:hypothetical protein